MTLALAAPLAEAQQEAGACIQAQAEVLKLPGPAAARVAFPDLPDLTARTALTWCRMLGEADPALRSFWPSSKPRRIEARTQSGSDEIMLRQFEEEIRVFAAETYGIRLAGDFVILAANNSTSLQGMIRDLLRGPDGTVPKLSIRMERYCRKNTIGGFAGRGFIAVCWDPDLLRTAPRRSGRLSKLLAHEFVHAAQYELAEDMPPRFRNGQPVLGPAWMVEGTAEYFEASYSRAGVPPDGTEFFNLQSPARKSRVLLSDLRGHVHSSSEYGVAGFAALLLAQKHGGSALFEYFRVLARTEDQQIAFQRVFGVQMGDFEREFETLRRQFGKARSYGREE